MENEIVEIIKDVPSNPFNGQLIKNSKPLKKISEEEVKSIKDKNKKKLIETIMPQEPIMATNKISKAEVERIKSKNKKNGKTFTEKFFKESFIGIKPKKELNKNKKI